MSGCRLLGIGRGALLAMVVAGSAARSEGQWVVLFDGRALDGWEQKNGTAEYRVQGGAIVGRTREGSPNSFLVTEREYGDFELEFEVKVDDALNSGVQIRSRVKERATGGGADDQAGRVFGPQVEIETSPGLAGYLYGEATGRGWLTPEQRRKPHRHFRNGQWNRYRVVARGPRIRTWINDQPIEDLTDRQIYQTHARGSSGSRCTASTARPALTRWRGAICACGSCRMPSDPGTPRRPPAHRQGDSSDAGGREWWSYRSAVSQLRVSSPIGRQNCPRSIRMIWSGGRSEEAGSRPGTGRPASDRGWHRRDFAAAGRVPRSLARVAAAI
jgi:Domain of Unknown Function (DUF1080)